MSRRPPTARPGSYGAQLVIPLSLTRDQWKRIRGALGVTRLKTEHKRLIEAAAARYRRQSAQDRASRSQREQKAALEPIANLTKSLADQLTGLDDESSSRITEAGIDDLDVVTFHVVRLADAARSALDDIGETRGARRQLDALSVLFNDMAIIWRKLTKTRVTIDRVKTSTGYEPISPAAEFYKAIRDAVDPNVTQEQLSTVIAATRG